MYARTFKRNRLTGARGFTLIEVIVVVVMLGILAAIAIPNYSEYVRRGHRATAQAHLLALAARQVQFSVDRRVYASVAADLNLTAPAEIANRYNFSISVSATPPARFTITATPVTPGPQSDDRCGALAIDEAGRRGTPIVDPGGAAAVGGGTFKVVDVGSTPAGCW